MFIIKSVGFPETANIVQFSWYTNANKEFFQHAAKNCSLKGKTQKNMSLYSLL